MLLPLTDGLAITNHFDGEMAELADRHYSRRTVGARQFVYSGRKIVLRDAPGTVLFAWLYPDADKRVDGQTGYYCSIFRNESCRRSSDIIREAEGFAFRRWGADRCYTYIDPSKVRSVNPGYCFKMAGYMFVRVAQSGKHLLAKEITP